MSNCVVQVKEVQLQVFHRFQAVECILMTVIFKALVIIVMIIMFKVIVMIIIIIFSSHHMQVLHTGGQEQELDVLEAGEGKGVDNLVDVDVDFFILVQNVPLWGCR